MTPDPANVGASAAVPGPASGADPDVIAERCGVTGVHRANRTIVDCRSAAAVLADAVMEDPVGEWLLPDPAQRRRRLIRLFMVLVQHTIDQGEQGLVQAEWHEQRGLCGVALWLHLENTAGSRAGRGPVLDMGRIADALGSEGFDRFQILDELTRARHTTVRHAYLPSIGVAPQWQGQGIGQRMLEARLADYEKSGRWVYLVASSDRSRRLFERLEFETLRDPIVLPDDGPSLWRMVWAPQRHRATISAVNDWWHANGE